MKNQCDLKGLSIHSIYVWVKKNGGTVKPPQEFETENLWFKYLENIAWTIDECEKIIKKNKR